MARLTSPSGVVVDVSDKRAAQLAAVGYVAEKPSESKSAPKKASSRKSSSK